MSVISTKNKYKFKIKQGEPDEKGDVEEIAKAAFDGDDREEIIRCLKELD